MIRFTSRLLSMAVLIPAVSFAAGSDSQAPAAWQVPRLASPVQLERGGGQQALQPGQALMAGDRIETARLGRAVLEQEGVALRLGGESRLQLPAAADGRLELQQGALQVQAKALEVALIVALGAVEVRLQRGEAWMERGARGEVVCLLQGLAELRTPQGLLQLDQPQQCLLLGAQGRPLVISAGAGNALSHKLRRTAFQQPQGGTRVSSAAPAPAGVTVVLASYLDPTQAEVAASQRRAQGRRVEVLPFETPQGRRYRLTSGRYGTTASAKAALQQLKAEGEPDAWLAPLPSP